MIVTKSYIESIIHEEIVKYVINDEVVKYLKEASLPRGAIEIPGDTKHYYILSSDKTSYDAYQQSDNKLVGSGNKKGRDKVLKAAEAAEAAEAATSAEEEPGVFGSIYNWIFGQKDIEYYEGLPENLKTIEQDIKAGKKSDVVRCNDRGCAQWVSDTLKTTGGRGSAWHQHQLSLVKRSVFTNISNDLAGEAAAVFTKIKKGRGSNSEVEKLVRKFIPNQRVWKGALSLGDIVGLYYEGSPNHKLAFYQGATGTLPDRSGRPTKVADGPFFIKKGGAWVPGKTLSSGRGFGMNTHLGFVGAIYNGEPVIFHQAKGTVKAEPLKYIQNSSGKGSIKIMWNKQAQVITEEKGTMVPTGRAEGTKANIVAAKIDKTNLPDNIKNAVLAVALSQRAIMESLGIDKETLLILTNAAVGVTGRESGFGEGKRYKAIKWIENIASFAINSPIARAVVGEEGAPGWVLWTAGEMDTSIGPGQMKYGEHFGSEEAQLSGYAKEMGLHGAMSVTDYSKAVIGAIGILSLSYKKAAKLGYSVSSSGHSRQKFTSTGRAALDMALVGYNTSPGNVTNYCGTGEIKKKCEEAGQEPIAQNYIPAFKTPSGGKFLTSLGYISEVAQNMQTYKEIYRLF